MDIETFKKLKAAEITEKFSNGKVETNLANLKHWFEYAIVCGSKHESTQIANKKQLLAALSEWVPSQFGKDGEPRIASIFDALETERAMEITKEMADNLRDEFNLHPPVGLTPQQFVRIAARNVDLNTETELLHFMWQVGILWSTVMDRIAKMKQELPPLPPFPTEN